MERERGGFGAGAMSSVTKKSALKSSTKGQTSNLSSSSNMKGKSGAGKAHKSSASGVQGSRKSGMSASQVGDNKSHSLIVRDPDNPERDVTPLSLLDIVEPTEKTVDALMKLDLAAGVEVQISLG